MDLIRGSKLRPKSLCPLQVHLDGLSEIVSTQVVLLGVVFTVFMVSVVSCLKCFSCSANAPQEPRVWRYLFAVNKGSYAMDGYAEKLQTCISGNHTNVTQYECPPKPGYHSRCALQSGMLYFNTVSDSIPFTAFSRHCEYIPISNPPSNSCIFGQEASQYSQAKTNPERTNPDMPPDYGIKVTFDGSVCFCDTNLCNNDYLYYPSSSTRLCWSLHICIYTLLIRTLLIGL